MGLAEERFSGIAVQDVIHQLNHLIARFIQNIDRRTVFALAILIDVRIYQRRNDLFELVSNLVVSVHNVDIGRVEPECTDSFPKLILNRHFYGTIIDDNGIHVFGCDRNRLFRFFTHNIYLQLYVPFV